MISDVRSALYSNSTIDVCIDDRVRTYVFGVKLSGSLVVKNEAFIAWLVVVMTTSYISLSKIVIDNNLSMFL
jgi:hypothetical protein